MSSSSIFQTILNNDEYKNALFNINNLIKTHKLNDLSKIDKIYIYIEQLNNLIKTIYEENTTVPTLELGRGTYGVVYNHGESVIKNQYRGDNIYSIFKECLIQERLSKDSLYGNCVPKIINFAKRFNTKYSKYLPRIIMDKVDPVHYYSFDNFLEDLANNNIMTRKMKTLIFIKKLIGLATVLNHFQKTYGFIHNDFKEDNIYVSKDNTENMTNMYDVKIIDFGLSAMKEGDNYTMVQSDIIADCDMIYYSKIDNHYKNYSKSSDFVYLISNIIYYAQDKFNNILGKYSKNFMNQFSMTLYLPNNKNKRLQISELLELFNNSTEYLSFNLSKNIVKFRELITNVYCKTARKYIGILTKDDYKLIKKSVKDFYQKYTPKNMIALLNNFLSRHNLLSNTYTLSKPTSPFLFHSLQFSPTSSASQTSSRFFSARSIPSKSAPSKSAPSKSAPSRSAPLRSTSSRSAPSKSAPLRSAPLRSAPLRSAPLRSVPLRSTSSRSAPLRAVS